MESIRTNNPERIIPTSSVRGFPTREAANEYETANPESVLGGIFFSTLPSGSLGYVLQVYPLLRTIVPGPNTRINVNII